MTEALEKMLLLTSGITNSIVQPRYQRISKRFRCDVRPPKTSTITVVVRLIGH